MSETNEDNVFLFKPTQFLGPPAIFPPPLKGMVQTAVTFIVPGFVVGDKDKAIIEAIANKCSTKVHSITIARTENSETKKEASAITIAFYIHFESEVGESKNNNNIIFESYLLVEHFLSLLSFISGQKLSGVNIQSTITNNGQFSTILPVTRRTQTPKNQVIFTDHIKNIKPSEEIFSALSWFRRGIAERDPIETYSAFMVCLQILARILVSGKTIKTVCPHCGEMFAETEQSITSLVRELVTCHLGAPKSLFDKIWKARNAIIAHGNAPVTPQTLLELTELKFEAGRLALEGIKLSLGIPKAEPPFLTQSFFITDAFMYVD